MDTALSRYQLGVFAAIGALAICFALQALPGAVPSSPLLIPPLIAAGGVAWAAGLGPALLATGVGSAGILALILIGGGWGPAALVQLLLLLMISSGTAVLVSRRRDAYARAGDLATTNEIISQRIAGQLEERKRDAADLAAAEARLRASEERIRALVRNAPVILWELNLFGVVTLIEGQALAALGLDPNRLLGRSIDELMADTPEVAQSIRRAYEGEAVSTLAPVGDLVYETRYTARFDADGSVAGLVGVSSDVTVRERLMNALRRSQERLRFSLDAGKIGAWTWDAATGQHWWSERMELLHGLEPGSFPGTFDAFLDRVAPEDHAQFTDDWPAAVDDTHDLTIDYTAIWPDASRHRIRLNVRLFGDGPIDRGIGVAFDVTERERAAEEAVRAAGARARVEGVAVSAAELVKVLGEDIPQAVSVLERLETDDLPEDLALMAASALDGLRRAVDHAQAFERVAEIHLSQLSSS